MSTASIPSNDDDPFRRWAADSLALPADAAPIEVRQAFWRLLSDEEFVPPEFSHNAARLLLAGSLRNRAPTEPCDVALRHVSDALRDEVEHYSQTFFQLPVAERTERGKELWNRCQDQPMLAAWLRGLAHGSQVEPKSYLDRMDSAAPAHVPELVLLVLELFVLRPGQRACLRQTRLAEIASNAAAGGMHAWEEAATYLRRTSPGLAALEPDLIGHLAGLSERERQRQRTKSLNRLAKPQMERGVIARDRTSSTSYGLVFRAIWVIGVVASCLFLVLDPPQDRRYRISTFPSRIENQSIDQIFRNVEETLKRNGQEGERTNLERRQLQKSAIDVLMRRSPAAQVDSNVPFRSADELRWQAEEQTFNLLMSVDRALGRLPEPQELILPESLQKPHD